VTLTGLSPHTGYHYQVEVDGVSLARPSTFRTAPRPDQSDFAFVAFGDTRTQHAIHEQAVDRIQQLAPDFVLHTGDLVEHGGALEQWATFFEIEKPLMARAPLFPTLGNHEGNSVHYFDRFHLPGNERWYTFDYGNARFICLQVDGSAGFGPGSEQYVWLQKTLADNSQQWLVVYFHVPPYSALREDAAEIAVRQALSPLFERYGVDIVFNGHHHNYQRSVVGGVTYIVTGGGGAPTYVVAQPDEYVVVYANNYHVVHVEVRGQMLRATAITPEGEELDRFVLMAPE
jgi:predicted phosphodiesterase